MQPEHAVAHDVIVLRIVSSAQSYREQQQAQAAWQNANNEILDTFGTERLS